MTKPTEPPIADRVGISGATRFMAGRVRPVPVVGQSFAVSCRPSDRLFFARAANAESEFEARGPLIDSVAHSCVTGLFSQEPRSWHRFITRKLLP